jgi:hypothetical protein
MLAMGNPGSGYVGPAMRIGICGVFSRPGPSDDRTPIIRRRMIPHLR